MSAQKHPIRMSFTCHECGYDMHDRIKGEPCPECNTALDTRPDLPGSLKSTTLRVYLLVISIVAMPFVAMASFLIIMIAIFPNYHQKIIDRHFRISFRVAHKRRLIRLLVWVCIAEFAALMVISSIWPEALNWW